MNIDIYLDRHIKDILKNCTKIKLYIGQKYIEEIEVSNLKKDIQKFIEDNNLKITDLKTFGSCGIVLYL